MLLTESCGNNLKMGAVSTAVYKTYEISLVRAETYAFHTLFILGGH